MIWYAAVIFCNLALPVCSVDQITISGKLFTTKQACEEALDKGLTQKLANEKVQRTLPTKYGWLSGGCLERDKNWKPNPKEFFKEFGPKMYFRRKVYDA